MANNDINEVRDILFDTLRDLRNPDVKVDLDRAKLINDTAKHLIDTAKVENDYLRITNITRGSGFMPTGQPTALPSHIPTGSTSLAAQLSAATTTHKIKG